MTTGSLIVAGILVLLIALVNYNLLVLLLEHILYPQHMMVLHLILHHS